MPDYTCCRECLGEACLRAGFETVADYRITLATLREFDAAGPFGPGRGTPETPGAVAERADQLWGD